jgi:hypothetical protein
MCETDWAALGTWAAVVLALGLALHDSWRRRAENRVARRTNSQLIASDLIAEVVDGFQSLIELAHHYVHLRFDPNQVPAEPDFILRYQEGALTLRPIPGEGFSRDDLLALDPAMAVAIAKLRSDSRLLNANLKFMAEGRLPTGVDRQTLIARVAPTIAPAIYQLGRRYLELGKAVTPFASPEATAYFNGFNATVAEDVIRFVTQSAEGEPSAETRPTG